MLRTTNGKYAGRGPKCGTTSRMEGEVIAGTVTLGEPGRGPQPDPHVPSALKLGGDPRNVRVSGEESWPRLGAFKDAQYEGFRLTRYT